MTELTAAVPSRNRLRRALSMEWSSIGALGRVALIGLVLSLAAAIALGSRLPSQIQDRMLSGRLTELDAFVGDLMDTGFMDTDGPVATDMFDEALRHRLLGTNTVRVKVWAPDGTVVHSDAAGLVGRTFPLSPDLMEAFAGKPSFGAPDVSLYQNEFERGLSGLIEFYVPVVDNSGAVVTVFEVYQQSDALNKTFARIRRSIWVTIFIVFGLLVVFAAALTYTNWRASDRRRRQAEGLLGELAESQDEERERIIGLLHDEVGQPMYRILFGLQSLRDRLGGSDVEEEVTRLDGLARGIDKALRAEMRVLHHDIGGHESLSLTLSTIADVTRRETDLEVDAYLDPSVRVSPGCQAALIRAAEEALINARKHAAPTKVDMTLERRHGQVVLEVQDDGVGYRGPEGLGLATQRGRLEAVGGGLEVMSRGRGTLLRAWVPAEGDSK